jgi:hypothetical protein
MQPRQERQMSDQDSDNVINLGEHVRKLKDQALELEKFRLEEIQKAIRDLRKLNNGEKLSLKGEDKYGALLAENILLRSEPDFLQTLDGTPLTPLAQKIRNMFNLQSVPTVAEMLRVIRDFEQRGAECE